MRHCEERKRQSNPAFFRCAHFLDCFASLAMTVFSLRSMRFFALFAVKWFLLGFASLIASLRADL